MAVASMHPMQQEEPSKVASPTSPWKSFKRSVSLFFAPSPPPSPGLHSSSTATNAPTLTLKKEADSARTPLSLNAPLNSPLITTQNAPLHSRGTSSSSGRTTVDPVVQFSDFEKLKLIGRGDVGKVWLVRRKKDPNCEIDVEGEPEYFAMKLLSKKSLYARNKIRRAIVEQQILSASHHPFIVNLFHCLKTDKNLVFIMQLCEGGEFFRFLQNMPGRCLAENHARFYAAEVICALEYLHLNGWVYRDLSTYLFFPIRFITVGFPPGFLLNLQPSEIHWHLNPLTKSSLEPENILLHSSGHIMLTDFDLSKPSCSSPPSPRLVRTTSTFSLRRGVSKEDLINTRECTSHVRASSFVGTEEYIAPEIVKEGGHTSAVDWWCLGILIYEMIVCILLFLLVYI